jgi:glycerophosphoryl diester phosphodiesterase
VPQPASAVVAGREVSFTCHSALLAGVGLANSVAAIRDCLEAGVRRIEIDVHSLAGNDYLVCHANRLEEVSTSSGAVGRLTPAQALELRDNRDPSLRLSLLSEVVELARGYGSELQLDLKDWRPLTPERARALGALVQPLEGNVIVSSGHDWNLRALAREAPGLRLGFDPDRYVRARGRDDAPLPAKVGAYGYRDDHPLALGRSQTVADYLRDRFEILLTQCPAAVELFVEYELLVQAQDDGVALGDFLHERGVTLSAWTLDFVDADSLNVLERLAVAGVDRVTTNTTRQFVDALAQRATG